MGAPAYDVARRLPPLPGTATEVATVAALLGTPDPLLGPDATERAVTALAPGRPVVHLATHGLVDDRAPNRSFVALAGHDELTVGDIMGLDLGADLVVLSACHTGRGRSTAAGDIVGLVRATLATGSRHAIVSLWPVDDEAGCLLMTRTYEELLQGVGQAASSSTAWRPTSSASPGARCSTRWSPARPTPTCSPTSPRAGCGQASRAAGGAGGPL